MSFGTAPESNSKVKVGISDCLLGVEVRFNGGHKRSRICTDQLSSIFEYVSVCPEVEIGMSIPRPPIRLLSREPGRIDLVETDAPSKSYYDSIRALADQKAAMAEEICGFIFTSKSPSCGLYGVKVYLPNGHPNGSDRGVFAKAFCEKYPLLPVEESGRLNDPALRENFVMRTLVYHAWKQLTPDLTTQRLLEFHAKRKYLVMAHSPTAYRQLGKLLSDLKGTDLNLIAQRYINILMPALANPPTRGKHANVLSHLQGYLKSHLKPTEKLELRSLIEDYRLGFVPLIVPITLLHHFLRRHAKSTAYALMQAYLEPYPHRLGLRNQI